MFIYLYCMSVSDVGLVISPFVGGDLVYDPSPLDLVLKGQKQSGEVLFRVQKPIVTSMIEASVEYSRLLFDLFNGDEKDGKPVKGKRKSKISFILPSQKPIPRVLSPSAQWKGTPQTIRALTEWIGEHFIDTTECHMLSSLQRAIETLYSKQATPKRKRLICIFHKQHISPDLPLHFLEQKDGDPIDLIAYVNIQWNALFLKQKQKPCRPLDLLFLCTTSELEDGATTKFNYQVDKVNASVHLTPIAELKTMLHQFACLHFKLRPVRLTGIPMKGSTPSEGNKTYDVILLHPADNHDTYFASQSEMELEMVLENEVTLQWKSDKTLSRQLLTCDCIHRLTPLNVFSSPTISFTRYLISLKPVTCVTVSESGVSDYLSHYIIMQGNQMFLHCLRKPFSSLKKPTLKKFIDFYKSPNELNLRTTSFGNIVESSQLHPRNTKTQQEFLSCSLPSDADFHEIFTAPSIVEHTMWFPYHQGNTILCEKQTSVALTNMLSDLYSYFSKLGSLSATEINKGKAILQKLCSGLNNNDVAYFPGTKSEIREQYYKVMWNEIVTLSNRSKAYFSDKKSSALSDYIETLFPKNGEMPTKRKETKNEVVEIDIKPQPLTSPTRSGSNSGDLTHSGISLDQEKEKKSFPKRADPFENVDESSLFSLFWNAKLSTIPPVKNAL